MHGSKQLVILISANHNSTAVKADYAVGTDTEGIGEVLDSGSLKVDHYLNAVIQLTKSAIGPQQCRVPEHWHYLFNQKLKVWHDEHQQWRKDRKHPKATPKDTHGEDAQPPMTTVNATLPFQGSSSTVPPQTLQSLSSSTAVWPRQPQHRVLNFGIGTAFSPWLSTGLDILPAGDDHAATTITASPRADIASSDPSAHVTNMGDFSAAFPNGLYMWDELTDNMTDSFTAWAPQGGATGEWGDVMGFGSTMGNRET